MPRLSAAEADVVTWRGPKSLLGITVGRKHINGCYKCRPLPPRFPAQCPSDRCHMHVKGVIMIIVITIICCVYILTE